MVKWLNCLGEFGKNIGITLGNNIDSVQYIKDL